MNLIETANEGYIAFYQTISRYVYDIAGLEADPYLLSLSEVVDAEVVSNNYDESYTSLIRLGEGRLRAARLLGLDPIEVRARIRRDTDFRESVELAEEELAEEIEAHFLQRVKLGDAKDALTWLKKRRKDRWGDDAPQINIQNNVFPDAPTGSIIEEILAAQEKLREPLMLEKGDN